MKIGFFIEWGKGSLTSSGNVVGDELFGESLCRSINKQFPDCHAELFSFNYMPKEPIDVMVYLNDNSPYEKHARRHVLYWQNGYAKHSAGSMVERIGQRQYDGYIFFSRKLLDIHRSRGKEGLFLPFGVDLDAFYPKAKDTRLSHEVAYVGNDIKGDQATMRYLYPAVDFDFGLYGNWKIPVARYKFWKNWGWKAPYKKVFEKISRGKIPQEDVPSLYSTAKINLNCTIESCIEWDVITLRTYEVLACKGFLITDIVPVAWETMQGCMVFTQGAAQLKEQIKYYLAHEDQRCQIAQAGYEYVLKHASIDVRARELMEYLGKVVQ